MDSPRVWFGLGFIHYQQNKILFDSNYRYAKI